MAEHGDSHLLDVDRFEVARSVHRIVRGMHDGECPKCHTLVESLEMRYPRNMFDKPMSFDLVCPGCRFTITAEEQQAAIREFGPVMKKNLAVFENWRKGLSSI